MQVLRSAQRLICHVKFPLLASPAKALLETVVLQRDMMPDQAQLNAAGAATMQPLGYMQFKEAALGRSEAQLGHSCNADQRKTVIELRAGVHCVHGPPGTGVLSLLRMSVCPLSDACIMPRTNEWRLKVFREPLSVAAVPI